MKAIPLLSLLELIMDFLVYLAFIAQTESQDSEDHSLLDTLLEITGLDPEVIFSE